MQLTIYTDYAFRVLIYLGSKQEKSQISEIAEYYNISFNHLTKAVHHLSKLGYIRSQQGRGGGIELAKAPKEINLRKIIEACEPHMSLVECLGTSNNCVITPVCHLKNIFGKAREAFLKELANHTLADIIEHKNGELRRFIDH